MCNPVSLAVGAIGMSAVGTGASLYGQKQAADAQEEYAQRKYAQESDYYRQTEEFQHQRYIDNADRVSGEVRRNYSEIDERISQNAAVASMEINALARQSRELQTNEISMQAERGVTGQTADYLLDEIAFNEAQAAENIRLEQKWNLDRMMDARMEVEAQGAARIESMNPQPIPLPSLPQPIQQPDYLGGIMNFGASALSSLSVITSMNPPTPATAPPAPGTPGSNIVVPGSNHSYGSINRFGRMDFTRSYYGGH